MKKKWGKLSKSGKKVWKFFWEDDSIWSWLANIIVAFLLIRFIVYPFLGIILGTTYPIVAVVSESMEHGLDNNVICGLTDNNFRYSYSNYWHNCGQWYENNDITKEQFYKFPFRNGFDKGDVIILWRANYDNLEVGDILVFQGNKPQPIIHRIVKVREDKNVLYYQTKGDHNAGSLSDGSEDKISLERVYGKGVLRVPYLGWVKILFVDAVKPLGIKIER